jgi:hypothetical protein
MGARRDITCKAPVITQASILVSLQSTNLSFGLVNFLGIGQSHDWLHRIISLVTYLVRHKTRLGAFEKRDRTRGLTPNSGYALVVASSRTCPTWPLSRNNGRKPRGLRIFSDSVYGNSIFTLASRAPQCLVPA